MRKVSKAELEAGEQLLIELENYHDVSDETLEPIETGHPVHKAVGKWRQLLPRQKLPPEFSNIRNRLWTLSKRDRGEAKDAANHLAKLLLAKYPSLKDSCSYEATVSSDQWFYSPPPANSPFRYGPLTGELKQLKRWIGRGVERTLNKYNGRGSYYIMTEHGRKYSVWFSSAGIFEEASQRQNSESA